MIDNSYVTQYCIRCKEPLEKARVRSSSGICQICQRKKQLIKMKKYREKVAKIKINSII